MCYEVSIVVPIFNSSRYLRQCLDSILNQTYKYLDVVCVNDGSTDDSQSIIEEYVRLDKRVRFFQNSPDNKGAASARNLGLRKSRGEYIQFLDSDDFFELDMVETMLKKALENNSEVVVCRGKYYDDEKKTVGKMAHPDLQYAPDMEAFSWRDCKEYICEIVDNYSWNKLYRRQFILNNELFFSKLPISEDQYVSMIAPIVASRISVVDKAFIFYRIRTGKSLCDSKDVFPQGSFVGIYDVVKQYKKMGVWQDVKNSYLNVSIRLMREYFDQVNTFYNVKMLFEKYNQEIFPLLEAEELPKEVFHDKRVWEWYYLVTNKELEEILFEAARACGSEYTTAIMRFQVPYSMIEKNSRIVLVGKGIVGRYWYAQLVLSNYCEVVCWVNNTEEIPNDITFDSVISAR